MPRILLAGSPAHLRSLWNTLIADEVICGFGRTGNWFGSQTLNIKPDIMTIAKGLSSGYQPIGGSIVSDEIESVIAKDELIMATLIQAILWQQL